MAGFIVPVRNTGGVLEGFDRVVLIGRCRLEYRCSNTDPQEVLNMSCVLV